jgi:capsular exopolysaccharide synthesis family protein
MLATTATLLGLKPPSSAYLEGFRILRANLLAMHRREPFGSILITSAVAGEGKTTVALNLATVLALAGKRVAVVDADAEKQSLGRTLGLIDSPGLTDLCQGTVPVSEILTATEISSLWAVSVGMQAHIAPELASRPSMRGAIQELSSQAEFVILDATPLLGFSMALSLAPAVDLVLVVARARRQSDPVRHALSSLLEVGAKVGGVIINDILPQDSLATTSYYRYYQSGA